MRFRACLALLALSVAIPANPQVFGGPLSAPQSDPTDTNRYKLSGTVVNSVTNEPIRRALVTLFYQQQIPVMTNSDGRFEFSDLPRSSVTVTAQKPGYFSEQELSAGRHRPKAFPVGPDSTSIVIKLVPEAIISGRIVDPDGLPIPNLMIRAVTQRVIEGRKQWTQGTTDRTDADGGYRINNLMPGSYLVVAGPGHAQAFVAGADDTSDLGYPVAVYPGSSPMRINAGQHVEANFTIKPEPFYGVTGSVSGTSPGNRYFVQLIPRVPGVRMAMGGSPVDAESGTFSLPRIARGDYLLQARGMTVDPQNRRMMRSDLFGSVPISVRSNLMGVTIGVEPGLTIPVNVRVERTRDQSGPTPSQNFPRVQVRLMPDEEDRPPGFSSPDDPKDPSSQLVVKNVVPGHYRVELQSTLGDMYVASARYGMTDLLNGDLTIAPNATQSAIDIVLRDDGASLTVKLQGDDAKSPATILLVPDRGVPRLQETYQSGNDAAMQMGGLRPGSYTVLALEDVGNLEYTNRTALEPYLSRGTKTTLTPNQQATVTPQIIKGVSE
jgi:hypothetical protein